MKRLALALQALLFSLSVAWAQLPQAIDSTNAANITSGTLPAARMPALTGDTASSAGSTATTTTKINGVDQTTAWTLVSLAGAVTCPTGTITTYTGSYRWKNIGKTVFVQATVNITSVGTCQFALQFNAPVTANATGAIYIGNGVNTTTNALTLFSINGGAMGWTVVAPAANAYYGTLVYESS